MTVPDDADLATAGPPATVGRAPDGDPPDDVELARLLLSAGRVEDALARVDRVLSADPGSAQARQVRGMALSQLGRHGEAVDEMGRAMVPHDGPGARAALTFSSVQLALDALRAGSVDAAERHLQRALSVEDGDPDAHRWMAEVLRLRDRPDAALVHADRALAELGDDRPDTAAWVHAIRGQLLRALDRTGEAEDELRGALDTDPGLGWAHAELGELLRMIGRPEDGHRHLRRATELQPRDAWSWASFGAAQQQLGLHEDALSSVDRAIELYPEYPWAMTVKAGILLGLDEVDRARDVVTGSLGIDDTDPFAHAVLGDILDLTGAASDEIDAAYSRAYALDPSIPFGAALASHRIHAGRVEEGEQLLAEILGRRDADPAGMSVSDQQGLGWAALRAGQYDRAARLLGAAAAADTVGVTSHFDLALNSLLSGSDELAYDRYADAVDRVQAMRSSGRQRYFLRVAEFDIGLVTADPRGLEVDPETLRAISDVLTSARRRIRREEERRDRARTRRLQVP